MNSSSPFQPLDESITTLPIEKLADDETAMVTAKWLFMRNCSECHGPDGTGKLGFPDLTDSDWLHGGTPDRIKQTIVDGRIGNMPAHTATMTPEEIDQVAGYVYTKAHGKAGVVDEASFFSGEGIFMHRCAVCHEDSREGNPTFGAPNLTDDVWLYGDRLEDIKISITHGGNGWMPDFGQHLSSTDIHLLTAYVYKLNLEPRID